MTKRRAAAPISRGTSCNSLPDLPGIAPGNCNHHRIPYTTVGRVLTLPFDFHTQPRLPVLSIADLRQLGCPLRGRFAPRRAIRLPRAPAKPRRGDHWSPAEFPNAPTKKQVIARSVSDVAPKRIVRRDTLRVQSVPPNSPHTVNLRRGDHWSPADFHTHHPKKHVIVKPVCELHNPYPPTSCCDTRQPLRLGKQGSRRSPQSPHCVTFVSKRPEFGSNLVSLHKLGTDFSHKM